MPPGTDRKTLFSPFRAPPTSRERDLQHVCVEPFITGRVDRNCRHARLYHICSRTQRRTDRETPSSATLPAPNDLNSAIFPRGRDRDGQ